MPFIHLNICACNLYRFLWSPVVDCGDSNLRRKIQLQMCWIWALGKRILKFPFRIISSLCTCFGFGKHSSFSSLRGLLKRMSFPASSTRESPAKRNEVSTFRIPTRFIGEMHVVLSALVIISCIGTLVNVSIKVSSTQSQEVILVGNGFILFTSITLIVSILDTGLSILLIRAAKEVNLDKCLFWYRSTITSLIAFSIFSVAFGVLLKSGLVLLGLLPSLIYKPFALWLVGGFIEDIYDAIRKSIPSTQLIVPLEMVGLVVGQDMFDSNSSRSDTTLLRQTSSEAPNTTTTSLGSGSYDRDEIKRKTTVFLLNKQVSRDHSVDPDGGIPRSSEIVTLTRIRSLPPE